MTRGGNAYELPMSGPRTGGNGASSLLPTPTTPSGGQQVPDDAIWVGSTAYRQNGTKVQVHLGAISKLLPTPAASNPNDTESVESWTARRARVKESANNGNGMGTPLSVAVRLLPTPRATDGTKGGPNQRGSSGDLMLPSAVVQLLPTPTTRDHKGANQRKDSTCLHGAIFNPPSNGGRASSDAPHPTPPSRDETDSDCHLF